MALSDETEDFLRRRSAGEHETPAQYSEPAGQHPSVPEMEAGDEPSRGFFDRIPEAIEAVAWLMIVVGITNCLRIIAGGPAVEASDLSWVDVVMNFFTATMLFVSARGNSVLTRNQHRHNT